MLPTPRAPELRLKKTSWPAPGPELSLTLGKGGVGKTTISAGLAFHWRQHGAEVAICSTDPAPSLDDVFAQPVGDEFAPVLGDRRLEAAEIDAAVHFHRWAARMKQRIGGALQAESGGLHIDLSFERRLFEALLEITPPGLDELFGVLRVSDALASKPNVKLVLDMAPTGHALELLRTPERILTWSRLLLKSLATHRKLPFARDLGAEIAQFSSRVRELGTRLRNRRGTAAWTVMLAEPLPDRETSRLLGGLRELGIHPAGIFVDRLLSARQVTGCAHCRRQRAWQLHSLAGVRHRAAGTIFCVGEQPAEISGRQRLTALTSSLWQLA